MNFHGLWVKFDGDIPGAHRSEDGKVVGIYNAGYPKDSPPVPPFIAVVDPSGHNLVRVERGEAANVRVDPSEVKFEVVADYADCPRERVKHLLDSE